ncbi:MAG: Type 1 glutamine amidotransferase-like domain-containing protein [Saprospiraceae bacterium]
MKPIYLLSDSALFFQKNAAKEYYLHNIPAGLEAAEPSVVYIGASNGDVPDFFEIFQAGMQNLGLKNCTHVKASFDATEQKALREADLILLSGGDPRLGWEVMEAQGMIEIIRQKYLTETVLMGVSAGAIQLAWELCSEDGETTQPMFQFAPFLVDVHDEDQDWRRLKQSIKQSPSMKRGLGICKQSGLIYHDDQTLEMLGKPAHEFIYKDELLSESLLWEKNLD